MRSERKRGVCLGSTRRHLINVPTDAGVIIFEYYCESVMIMVLGKVLAGAGEVLEGVLERCWGRCWITPSRGWRGGETE